VTRSGTNGLLCKIEDVARASFLELFFDVVFIFALRALAQQLINNLTWSGAYQALVLLLAIGWVWSITARITGALNPRWPPVQLLMIATMVGALVLSAAVPEAFGKTGLIFAVCSSSASAKSLWPSDRASPVAALLPPRPWRSW
jgi:low temperature requirement protein LtrA